MLKNGGFGFRLRAFTLTKFQPGFYQTFTREADDKTAASEAFERTDALGSISHDDGTAFMAAFKIYVRATLKARGKWSFNQNARGKQVNEEVSVGLLFCTEYIQSWSGCKEVDVVV
ncbi:hypothetical protein LTR10_023067 [Elasticomyces elasticus]|uniref:Uncharacterized protein n=1 Tax=Exophiala sideris TaxID=1016849 RepID=A0ABR0IV63_9EURO|nr:hypothetical protein LTR10_023067 [Elasticomyces elasticus]KAK5021088.1 hypothetical protein LTS07_011241 [Exophiala sideris]KAK5023286.1 hypothetical protein LTR13_011276 [Exophiala sideris]KAK5048805.1 hypothetical protein LTR69_011268 [Exophiala sideris]KAK5176258.1 hypothetical protein LTR44_011189 [Eurotiomycetes sp. CCFEE 6388]